MVARGRVASDRRSQLPVSTPAWLAGRKPRRMPSEGPMSGPIYPSPQVLCPLCGSTAALRVRDYDTCWILAVWRDLLRVDVLAELPELGTIRLWSCQNCRLEYFLPAKAGSGTFYAQLQAIPSYYPSFKWEHAQALAQTRSGERVLEVGCGTGDFLGRLRNAGAKAEGLELNEAAAHIARKHGLRARCEPMSTLIRAGAVYDTVMAFQVLEHVPDPGDFLRQCVSLLKPEPGARLVIGVPDADGYHRHVLDPFDLPPHHMTRWTRRSLMFAAEMLGLRLDRLAASPLDDAHAFMWASGTLGRATGKLVDVTRPAGFAARALARLVRTSGLKRWIPGHTVYASFSRPSGL